MKFEEKIKELVDQHEFPFDAAAWEAVNKSLDSKAAVSKASITASKSWMGIVAACAVLAIAGIYFATTRTVTESELDHQKLTSQNESSDKGASSKDASDNSKQDLKDTKSTQKALGTNSGSSQIAPQDKQSNKPSETPSNRGIASAHNGKIPVLEQIDYSRGYYPVDDSKPATIFTPYDRATTGRMEVEDASIVNYEPLHIPDKYPVNMSWPINNRNPYSLYIYEGTKLVDEIKPKSYKTLKFVNEGSYLVKNIENRETESFEVIAVKHFALEINGDVNHNTGLPVYTLKVNTEATAFTVKNASNILVSTNSYYFKVVSFTRGTEVYTVNYNLPDGTVHEEKISIDIPSTYSLNLGGGNDAAFDPDASDLLARSFMPVALTIRSTPFTLYIFDRETGRMVYKTSDVNEPWTGIDLESGRLVPMNKTYIWKVVLEKPLANENREYKGTVTYLPR